MTSALYDGRAMTPRAAAGSGIRGASSVLPESWISPTDGSELHLIAAGEFIMGSTTEQVAAAKRMDKDGPLFALASEQPQFRAELTAFYLGVCAVTNTQYARFLNEIHPAPERTILWLDSPAHLLPPVRLKESWRVEADYHDHPVDAVSWYGAVAYCRWAGLRLPKEIEWEKGARGVDGRLFPWGDDWHDELLCWYGGDRRDEETTAPVNAYPEGRSPYGLFQMAGNVEEWCADPYRDDAYPRYARGDLRPPTSGLGRVMRGGACLRRNKLEFRCAMRRGHPPALRNILYTGFRCACDVTRVVSPTPYRRLFA